MIGLAVAGLVLWQFRIFLHDMRGLDALILETAYVVPVCTQMHLNAPGLIDATDPPNTAGLHG